MKKLITLLTLIAMYAAANVPCVNTNIIILTGAGTAAVNQTFVWTNGGPWYGGATNAYLATNGAVIEFAAGWYAGDWICAGPGAWGYVLYQAWNTNFPAAWTMGFGTNPPPTGVFGSITITNWEVSTISYFSQTNDSVAFSAAGRNWSSSGASNQVILTVDGNPVFTGPWMAGAGHAWSLSGSVNWNGTNFFGNATMTTGDTNNPIWTDTEIVTNAISGTNTWDWIVSGDTNGLTFDAASIVADRAPTNDAPAKSLSATIPGTIYASNAWNLVAITQAMPNFSFWTGNSNGAALVTISLSNGVVRYLQALH